MRVRYRHNAGFGGGALHHGGRRTLSSGYVSKSTTVNLDTYRGGRFRSVLGDELSRTAGMNPVTPPASSAFINLNCDLRVAGPVYGLAGARLPRRRVRMRVRYRHNAGFGGGSRYQGGRRTLSSGYVSKSTTVTLDTYRGKHFGGFLGGKLSWPAGMNQATPPAKSLFVKVN